MKELFCALIFAIAASGTISAQKNDIDNCIGYLKVGDLQNAFLSIESATKNAELQNKAKTWFYRGMVCQKIADGQGGSGSVIIKDPLTAAFESYNKALLLDTEKEYNKDIITALRVISDDFIRQGIVFFNNKQFAQALTCFESTLEINDHPAVMNLDTIVIYNAGLAAEKANNLEKAEKYYSKLIQLKFGGAKIYLELANILGLQNKTEQKLKTLEDGIKNFPSDNNSLIAETINLFLETGRNAEALKYVEMGLEKEPANSMYHYIRGGLYDQMKDYIKAEESYKKATDLNPTLVDALYNLGAIYYNQGVDLLNGPTTSKDQKIKADEKFRLAMEYFEKVLVLQPNDMEAMKQLKSIYTVLGLTDKLNAINAKLGNN